MENNAIESEFCLAIFMPFGGDLAAPLRHIKFEPKSYNDTRPPPPRFVRSLRIQAGRFIVAKGEAQRIEKPKLVTREALGTTILLTSLHFR